VGVPAALVMVFALYAGLKMELEPARKTLALWTSGIAFLVMLASIWCWRWIMKPLYGYAGEEHGRNHPHVRQYVQDGYRVVRRKKADGD
jgi:hypothetical protein